jgi:hypothetical protein
MNPTKDFGPQMAGKTDEELMEMFRHSEDWTSEALEAARMELQRRGISVTIRPVDPSPMPEGRVVFFPVSPLKLVVMSTVTFGLYEVYWFYQNWKLIKQRTGLNIMPFWRAVFGVLFCYPFFREVEDAAASRKISFPASPGLLAVAWIILALTSRLPVPYWLICWLTPLVLIPVQDTVNRLNAVIVPGHDPNSRFSGWNIAGVLIGGILFVFSMIGAFSH